MSKLIVRGLGSLDGEYPCDLIGMNSIGHPECMTNREGNRVKELCGARAGEILDEFVRADSGVQVALAVVVLERAGKRVDVDQLLDAPIGSGISFVVGEREDDAGPPSEAPPQDEQSDEQKSQSTSGGDDSKDGSENPENDPSPTGPHPSETPSKERDSVLQTSAT